MITKEQKINKYCCLYVNDFHLEMILLPFIKRKMEVSKVLIFTQNNLSESIELLIKRINLNDEIKKNILEIENWDNKDRRIINNNDIKEYTIIINGDEKYKKGIYKDIEKLNIIKLNIVDCYDVNNCKEKINEIKNKYNGILNTEKIY